MRKEDIPGVIFAILFTLLIVAIVSLSIILKIEFFLFFLDRI